MSNTTPDTAAVITNADAATLAELLAAQAQLNATIDARRAAVRTEAITKVRKFVAENGLTSDDVFPPAGVKKVRAPAGPLPEGGKKRGRPSKAEIAARLAAAGGNTTPPAEGAAAPAATNKAPVVTAYKNPADGATWKGKGFMPKWLSQAIADGVAAGKTKESVLGTFAVIDDADAL